MRIGRGLTVLRGLMMLAERLTQQLRDARVDVEDVVAEERRLLRVSVVPCEDFVQEPLAPREVVGAAGQAAAHLHHQLVGQELQAVHGS